MKYSFRFEHLWWPRCVQRTNHAAVKANYFKRKYFFYFICFCSYNLSWNSVDHIECVLWHSQPIYLLQLRPHFSGDVAARHWELPNNMSSHSKRMDTSISDSPSTHRKNTLQLQSLTFKLTHRLKWQIFINVKQMD